MGGLREVIKLFSREADIVKTMRLIEKLKAAVIGHVGAVYQAFAEGGEQGIRQTMANLVVNCYVLAQRAGIDYSELEELVRVKAEEYARLNDSLEQRFGDYAKLARHMNNKR